MRDRQEVDIDDKSDFLCKKEAERIVKRIGGKLPGISFSEMTGYVMWVDGTKFLFRAGMESCSADECFFDGLDRLIAGAVSSIHDRFGSLALERMLRGSLMLMKELECKRGSGVLAGRLFDAISIVDAYKTTKNMKDEEVVGWNIGYGNPNALTLRTWCVDELRARGLMRRKRK